MNQADRGHFGGDALLSGLTLVLLAGLTWIVIVMSGQHRLLPVRGDLAAAAAVRPHAPPAREPYAAGPGHDLCAAMAAAGAKDFGRGGLELFKSLQYAAPGVAAVRARRCSFRTYGVDYPHHQDLAVGLSAPVASHEFHARILAARSSQFARFSRETGLGLDGYSLTRAGARDVELVYLLEDGRQLELRVRGQRTEPDGDLSELRSFARRIAGNM